MITNVLERQRMLDELESELQAMDAQWEAEADRIMNRPGEDEETYIKEYRERLAAMHHEDEAPDEEVLERWADAKKMIRRSVRERKARRRADMAQRVAAGIGLGLLALGWIGLLALLWG